MNEMNNLAPAAMLDSLESRFALRVASRLTEQSQELGPDVRERLRFAREQALERARTARPVEVPVNVGVGRGGVALLGRARTGWWIRIASVVPAFALIGGLVLIQQWQDRNQISVAAEIDAALLADDLPPKAYSDAGFVEFLKSPRE
jgi:hypothetical protein